MEIEYTIVKMREIMGHQDWEDIKPEKRGH
jgi:hypothetical protein